MTLPLPENPDAAAIVTAIGALTTAAENIAWQVETATLLELAVRMRDPYMAGTELVAQVAKRLGVAPPSSGSTS